MQGCHILVLELAVVTQMFANYSLRFHLIWPVGILSKNWNLFHILNFFFPVDLDEAHRPTWCQQRTPKLLVEIYKSKREGE